MNSLQFFFILAALGLRMSAANKGLYLFHVQTREGLLD